MDEQTKPIKEIIGELTSYFAAETGIVVPIVGKTMKGSVAGARWFNPLREMYYESGEDMATTKQIITLSISHMRGDQLTITAPGSIRKTFSAMLAEENSGARTKAW